MENLKIDNVIHDTGFGILSRKVMRNKQLSIEAKAIYSYLISFAGNSYKAFPSVELIIEELDISRSRFYKYMNQLKEYGFVKVVQEKEKENYKFKRNVYYLIDNPDVVVENTSINTDEDNKKPCTSFKDTGNEKPCASFEYTGFQDKKELQTAIDVTSKEKKSKKPCTSFPHTGNEYTNNNSFNNNNNNNTPIKKSSFKKETMNSVLDDFTKIGESEIDNDLKNALVEFYKMRKNMKSTLTIISLKLHLDNLKKLSKDKSEQLKIVNQSIMLNWKGFYPLNDSSRKNNNSKGFFNFDNKHNYDESFYEDLAIRKREELMRRINGQ